MNELSKMRRVIQKIIPDAPHEVLLVLEVQQDKTLSNRQSSLLRQQA
jgi:signal recognition particle GTPase